MNQAAFSDPPEIYRGTDFWMLNDRLSEDGIVMQLTEMKKQGVYSFIARTYIGLKSDYPGPDFKSKTALIIETAKRLGLKVFLQACYMPEAVVDLPCQYALRYILPVKNGEEGTRRVLCRKGDYSFVEHNSETFLDMFDPDAMDYYIRKCYGEMWREFSSEFGKTVLSVWVDEPCYRGGLVPMTAKAESAFLQKWGYSLSDEAWKLFEDGEGYETVRYHYRVMMRDLMEENYFKKVRRWCNEHGLLFSGHLMLEETLSSQIYRASAVMPYYKYFDIPGIDVLGGQMNWVDEPIRDGGEIETLYAASMQCVSAARQAGREHILAEMYGVVGEHMGFRNMLHMFDSYASMGINHRCVHGMFYSLHGRGKRAYPPHINYYQPYWEKYKNVTDYCARVSYFISEGVTEGEIAILHPLESAYCIYHGTLGDRKYGGDNAYDQKFISLLIFLKTLHRDPELCDLATLRDMGSVQNRRLQIGKMDFGTLLLPNIKVLTADALELIKQFTASGGRLILLGELPTLLDGYPNESLAADLQALPNSFVASDLVALEKLLAADKLPYRLEGRGAKDLLVNRRKVGNGYHFFLFNNDCSHTSRATLTVEGCYKVSLCNGFDGSITACPAISGEETALSLEVPCGGSLMLWLEEGTTAEADINSGKRHTLLSLNGTWTASPESQNTLLLEYFSYKTEQGGFSRPFPIAAIQKLLTDGEYEGPLTLCCLLELKDDLSLLSLALEDPSKQQIYVDGRPLQMKVTGHFCDRCFETVTVGDLGAGTHILEIKRQFRPLSKFKSSITSLFETQLGVELEPMYLLGDFTVKTVPVFSRNGCRVVKNGFVLQKRPSPIRTDGELCEAGFPFFTGIMQLSKTADLTEEEAKAGGKLRIGSLFAAVAEVYVNGTHVGDINRAPCEIDCRGLLQPGENKISLRLFTTLRPIIGPFHRPRGEIGNTFGGGYQNPDAAWLSVDVTKPHWENLLSTPSPTFTEDYNLISLGVEDVALVFQ